MKFDPRTASEVEILLRLSNRAERLLRFQDDTDAPEFLLTDTKRMLTDVAAEWLRRYPPAQ